MLWLANCEWLLQRQFHRLIEMLILLRLDPHDARALKAYRLQVKERLYRFNFVSHHYKPSVIYSRCDI